MEIPCLIIAYARSVNVEKLVRDLHLQGENLFYVAIDGARSSDISKIQDDLLLRLSSLTEELSISIKIWHRSENMGIAISVITALDWFFSHEEFGLVLEDDLQVSSDLLGFVENSLQISDADTVIWSGNRFFPHPESCVLSSYPATWGWATTKRNWLLMRNSIVNFPKPKINKLFSSDYQFWLLGALRVYLGKIDTWDIPVALFMKNESKYSMLPPRNLVSNIGADSFASHTLISDFPIGIPVETLDVVELDSSKIVTREYDRKLRVLVYKVKLRHFFLAPFILFEYISIIFSKKTLRSRLLKLGLEH